MSEFPLGAGDCEALLAGMRCGVAICDDGDRVLWVNARFCELLGRDAAALTGKPIAELVGAPLESLADGIERFRVGGHGGDERWLECARARAGTFGLRLFTDITGFAARRKSRTAAVWGLDPLRLDAETGVLNRRTILQELNSQISRSRRYGNALGVLELRLSTTPSAAEQARQELAECLKNVLRWADFIGTLSEESFLIVLPETEAAAVDAVTEKIRAAWNAPETARVSAPVTLEFSTTTWTKGDNLDRVLQRLAPESKSLSAGKDG